MPRWKHQRRFSGCPSFAISGKGGSGAAPENTYARNAARLGWQWEFRICATIYAGAGLLARVVILRGSFRPEESSSI